MKNRACCLVSVGVILSMLGGVVWAQPCSPSQVAAMVPDDGAPGDTYGWAVGIDGDIAAVGALYEGVGGSVYVLGFDGSSWDQVDKLVASGLGPGDGFGDAVAVSGDTIVIGAPGDDDAGSGAGAVYVFTDVGGAWTQTAKLVPASLVDGDNFGSSVEIDGDTIVIGASLVDSAGSSSGKAFVYRRVGGAWGLEAELLSNDIAQFDRFGSDVAISGDRVLIGADSDDDMGSSSGSAYVFERTGTVWTQAAKLVASDGSADDQFGERLDIDQDSIIVGARYDWTADTWAGSAYVFEYDGSAWIQYTKLVAFDGAIAEFFGQDVAIHNGRAIVGAWGQKDMFGENNAGAAYVFSRTASGWGLDSKMIASDQAGFDYYGYSVGITDAHAIVGADGNDDFWWGADVGSAYLIELGCVEVCVADFNGDGVLDILDVFAFLDAYNSSSLVADLTGDGVVDISDVFAFLDSYNVGCL